MGHTHARLTISCSDSIQKSTSLPVFGDPTQRHRVIDFPDPEWHNETA